MRPEERFERAVRPLRFVARRDFANLDVVKDLEATVRRGLAPLEDDPSLRTRTQAVLAAIAGIDGVPREARIDKIRAALAAAGPAAGASPSTSPEPSPSTSPEPSTAGRPEATAKLPGRPPGPADRSSGSGRGPTPSGTAAADTDGGGGIEARAIEDAARTRRGIFLAAARPPTAPARRAKRLALEDAGPEDELSGLVGVPPKTAERLADKGVRTVQDALFFLPRRHEAAAEACPIERLVPGQRAIVRGVVAASALRFGGRRRYWEMAIRDGTGVLSCRFFRFSRRTFETRYPVGTRVEVEGAVTTFGARRQMAHPELRLVSDDGPVETGEARVLYPEVPGVAPKTLSRIMHRIVEATVERAHDPVPEALRARLGLPPIAPALRAAHFPGDGAERAVAQLRARLAFDELFFLQLALGSVRGRRGAVPGLAQVVPPWGPLAERGLPFAPTGAQARALDEIAADLAAPHPMRRLVQGDVGSGKTAVAWLTAGMVHAAGRQTLMLAPTEILAEQHAEGGAAVLGRLGMNMALVTGSTPARARASAMRALRRGDIHAVVGTHALLEPDVAPKDLGLVIVDEQHRFGVEQRARLLAKRDDVPPDVLLMTATPIPRTLTLSLYGDLHLSVIDELPPGRTPTETRVFHRASAKKAYAAVKQQLDAGRQAFVVFPLVEASEQLDLRSATESAGELAEALAPHRVAVLHGRMRADEKSKVMGAFVRGEVAVLVSTTVVEVGVNVPNATVMVVEEADRFGLSQLHQLRGRVGRGSHPGSCFLVAATADSSERLAIMAESNDGFLIAEKDLEIRGPGEMLGTRQSGLPDLFVADLVADRRLVELARRESEAILEGERGLSAWPEIAAEVERRFGDRLERLGAG